MYTFFEHMYQHDIRNLHFAEFTKYVTEESHRPLNVVFFRPYQQTYQTGMKVLVEWDPDDSDDTENNNKSEGGYEKARILGFNDMKGEYKVKFLQDGTTDNEVPEDEIKPMPTNEEDTDDDEVDEDTGN